MLISYNVWCINVKLKCVSPSMLAKSPVHFNCMFVGSFLSNLLQVPLLCLLISLLSTIVVRQKLNRLLPWQIPGVHTESCLVWNSMEGIEEPCTKLCLYYTACDVSRWSLTVLPHLCRQRALCTSTVCSLVHCSPIYSIVSVCNWFRTGCPPLTCRWIILPQ